MALTITLLGVAGAARDGRPVTGIRGRKAWAVLAYLLLAGAPVSRERLARVLFPDAGDPAGVLRWNLSQLRRVLGVGIAGDPVAVTVPSGSTVDVWVLEGRDLDDAVALPGLGEDLLAGTWGGESAAFEVWLEGERRHLRSASADVLREATLRDLARGRADDAVALAERLHRLAPLDEDSGVLLVRALQAAGHGAQARSVAEDVAARLRRELEVEPPAALQAALHAPRRGAGRAASGRLAVAAGREAGIAALGAGAVDAGLDQLREALGGARALGDPEVTAGALTDLGSALIHAVRGVDQDGAALLHEAVSLHEVGRVPGDVVATAMRELGYVELLRGRYPRAEAWLVRAADAADAGADEQAWIGTFAGAASTDTADYPRAAGRLDDAVARADAAGGPTVQAQSRSMRGRLRLLTGDLDGAVTDLDAAVALATSHGLRAMAPWPVTLRAEVDLLAGHDDDAMRRLEHADATSRQIGDPCWEAMALRGLGLAHARRGEVARGFELLDAAPVECRRLPDTYRWIEAYALDSLATLAVERGMERATEWVSCLDGLATAHGMRHLSLRAARHRAVLGEPGAGDLVEARAAALTEASAPAW